MKAGKIASLVLAGGFGAVSTVVAVLALRAPILYAHSHEQNVISVALELWAILSLVLLVLLFPIGASIDRIIISLRRNFEATAGADRSSETLKGPRLLRPLFNATAAAVDQFRTDRLLLSKRLREAESRHTHAESQQRHSEAVLHTLRDAVIVTDAGDRIIMVNEAASEIFGLEMNVVQHQPMTQIIPAPRLCDLIRDMRETSNIGELRHQGISIPVFKNGQRDPDNKLTFDVCLMCVEQSDGDMGGVVAVLHDMTQEQELAELKTDFVSKASHELRTPLSSIRAYVEMLIDGEAEDEASRQEFYRVIYEETDRLSQLIDNMLNLSRIEAGMVQIERQEIRVSTLTEQTVAAMAPQAREKNLTLVEGAEGLNLTVEADRDMLYQVLLNLVSNAVKYTPEGGRITLSAEEDQLTRSVIFSVTDTGLGVPPEAQERIFEKFYRIENYSQMAKGTGLGLTLCKHIVESLHHGSIGVDSRPGMGAKFWFSIPIRHQGSRTAA